MRDCRQLILREVDFAQRSARLDAAQNVLRLLELAARRVEHLQIDVSRNRFADEQRRAAAVVARKLERFELDIVVEPLGENGGRVVRKVRLADVESAQVASSRNHCEQLFHAAVVQLVEANVELDQRRSAKQRLPLSNPFAGQSDIFLFLFFFEKKKKS